MRRWARDMAGVYRQLGVSFEPAVDGASSDDAGTSTSHGEAEVA